ncbi:unnamed protein product [Caenorhabditis brenneri]
MAEFLKNNPIALRHCLLYQFLQEKSVGKAFPGFCYVVGGDVIKKDSFNFWFDKFNRGLFDDIIEPMTDMRDILRNDKHALRTCILYELLKYKRREKNINKSYSKSYSKLVHSSSSSAYKNFCGVIGDDAIEYREFDFWFYRFLNGEFDLNFERDKEKMIYEMMEMPLDVMRNIVEYLDIFDRMSLVKTSRSFKTFVEDQKLFHSELSLYVDDDEAYITHGIEYRTTWYHKYRMYTERVPYWEEAIQKVKAVLNYPKLHLDTLNIKIHTDSPTLMEKMIDELAPTHRVHSKKFVFKSNSTDSLLKMLPLFTPGYLITIDVHIQEMDNTVMEKVAELEQWKQAKYLLMGGCEFVPVHHMYHFKEISVCWVNLSAEDIREMKEVLFTSPVFQKCNFALGYHTEKSIIKEEFGDPIPEERHTYHYPIPNSNEMTEFLKNNPIALSHCRLYEQLKKKSVEVAFTDFCSVVGKDAIKKEAFQKWFDRFKQGMFDESITDMRNTLRSDKYALRACVLYESLKYQSEKLNVPIFEVFANFCKVIDDEDVLKFQEFEFLFYRFLNGEYDLNYERDKEKKIYELIDMPIDVMKNIAEYLDIFDRWKLAQTSRSCLTFIENQTFFHDTLKLHIHRRNTYISFGSNIKSKKYTILKNALANFRNILKHPKLHLDTLILDFEFEGNRLNTSTDKLKATFKFTHQLSIENLEYKSRYLKPLLSILPSLKPGYLTTIKLSVKQPEEKEIEKLIELEQWKQAKRLDLDGGSDTTGAVRQMKEFLSNSPNFKKCLMNFGLFDIDKSEIKQEFGEAVRGRPNTFHYPIPNSNEYFEITLNGRKIKTTRKIR